MDALAAERQKASFDVAALRTLINGKRPETTTKFKPLFEGPEFDASMDDFLSYTELFEAQLGRAAKAISIIRDNPKLMMTHQSQKVAMTDLFDTGAMGIHFIAYLPFLRTQANKEQKKAWLDGAMNAEYVTRSNLCLSHLCIMRGMPIQVLWRLRADGARPRVKRART